MLSGMKLGVVFLAALLCTSEVAAQTSASNFLTWLKEAGAASRFEDRLRTHERALDAILKADATTLEAVLLLWCQDDDRYRKNDFVQMAWRRLAQIDTPRAVKLLENVDDEYAFYLNAKEVWAEVARNDPARAYIAAQSFVPQNKEQHERKWLVQHIMQAVGAAWFRVSGLETLKRLPTLSHPELMATSVFKGCVDEAKTAEQKIALLDRFAGDEQPVIIDKTAKGPQLCDELVRAAALADLPGTRAWIEKRFPPGTKRQGNWHIKRARQALFYVWKQTDTSAAAEWLLAQQHPDEDSDTNHAIRIASAAIAGEDRENMLAALAWLEKQARPQDRVAALVGFLDDDFGEDTVLRQSRQTIATWLSQRPIDEREAVVLTAAEDYIRLQAKGDFLTIVFPDEPKRREMVARLDKITGPPSNFEENSFMLRVFDLKPHRDQKLVVSAADEGRSRELASLHELQRTGADPARRREGLEALKWMKSAAPVQIGPVLLAYLQNHRMDWFSEDLLSAWVLQDWRACEAFAMNAPLSAHKRDDMLIHIFSVTGEQHPEKVLARLRELVQAKVLVPTALNGGSGGSRVMWLTSYDGEMIIRGLTHGLLRQGDMKALATVRTLPTGWQIGAFEVLSESFATPECGKAVLDHFEHAHKEQKERHGEIVQDYTPEVTQVISRLASISPADAVRWLESRPERLGEHEWRDSPLCQMHAVWSKTNPKAADAWMERVRRENPPKKTDSPESGPKHKSWPLLPTR